MNEHTLCCGTVADKSKLCAEIDQRDSVIRAKQRRIGELLQERDEALAYAERLRDEITAIMIDSFGVSGYHLNGDVAECGEFSELETIISETPPEALSALKAQWQAEAVENAIRELPYCGYDGQAWASELEQYAL
eukprot:GHVR01081565.1.p1 GENE.GHVR01081565.1~~GHVR01081565.1.p1  ORF type:complete len:135 (-),score=34.52 GHVR01081565.1:100-504(-)